MKNKLFSFLLVLILTAVTLLITACNNTNDSEAEAETTFSTTTAKTETSFAFDETGTFTTDEANFDLTTFAEDENTKNTQTTTVKSSPVNATSARDNNNSNNSNSGNNSGGNSNNNTNSNKPKTTQATPKATNPPPKSTQKPAEVIPAEYKAYMKPYDKTQIKNDIIAYAKSKGLTYATTNGVHTLDLNHGWYGPVDSSWYFNVKTGEKDLDQAKRFKNDCLDQVDGLIELCSDDPYWRGNNADIYFNIAFEDKSNNEILVCMPYG